MLKQQEELLIKVIYFYFKDYSFSLLLLSLDECSININARRVEFKY